MSLDNDHDLQELGCQNSEENFQPNMRLLPVHISFTVFRWIRGSVKHSKSLYNMLSSRLLIIGEEQIAALTHSLMEDLVKEGEKEKSLAFFAFASQD